MDYSEIENCFLSKNVDAVREVVIGIESLADLEKLRAIATRLNDFLNLYNAYKKKNPESIWNGSLDNTAHILTTIANGYCHCKIYTSDMGNNVTYHQRLGFVEIFEENKMNEPYMIANYKCICKFCGNKFYVEEGYSGFGTHCSWSKIS